MTFRLTLKNNQIGREFSTRMGDRGRKYRSALLRVAESTMEEMLTEGREDIRRSGNFESSRWIDGLRGRVVNRGGNIEIKLTHDVPYWTTHQFGATIRARSGGLLWIPLSFADDAQGVMARDFPGHLVRVDRKSGAAPLLIEVPGGEPKYFGKEQVTVPKRWHLVEEVREIAKTIPARFREAVRDL